MFYLAGISISFFLALLLLAKKNKSTADMILVVWLFIIGFQLSCFYLMITGQLHQYTWVIGFNFPIPILHGPLLFLYTATLSGQIPSLRIKDSLHFLPALLEYLYLIPFYGLSPEKKMFIMEHKGIGHETFVMINSLAITISGVGYVTMSMILLRRHRKSILDQYSDTEKINLNWLRYLVYGIGVIWVFVLAGNDNLVFTGAVLFVLMIGYFGIRQVGIFTMENRNSGDPEMEDSQSEPDQSTTGGHDPDEQLPAAGKKKYTRSGLTEEVSSELHDRLTQIMGHEQVFKESELTLSALAGRLNTHPNYLSQVINEKEGRNFYDFINTLRTEEFIRLASDPASRKFTLLGLALQCGFNSKSSFNKYFKKTTGLSPSEFLNRPESSEF